MLYSHLFSIILLKFSIVLTSISTLIGRRRLGRVEKTSRCITSVCKLLKESCIWNYSFLKETMNKQLEILTQRCDPGYAPHSFYNVSFPKLRYINLDGAHFLGINPGSIISVDTLLDYLMERCERDRCFVWIIAISPAMTSEDLKKLLLMLSGME